MAIRTMTQAEMQEYFQEFDLGGYTYTDEVPAPAGAATTVFTDFRGVAAIDAMASAMSSPDWDAGFMNTALGQRIWQRRNNSVLHELNGKDAKFVDDHKRAYRILIEKNGTDKNISTNSDVLVQKIAENKPARDKADADDKAKKDARRAEIHAVNRTELCDYIRANINTPELQAYRDIVDKLNPRNTSATKYADFLAGMVNDAQLLDTFNRFIGSPRASMPAFSAPFLSKIMTCGAYKYAEVMDDFPRSGNRYFNGGKETAGYTAMQTDFANIRTTTLTPLTAAKPDNTAIAAYADAYDSLIGTMPDADTKKAAHTTAVATARTETQTRTDAITGANTRSVINFIRENHEDVSMAAYRDMVDGNTIGTTRTVGGAPVTVTAANINQVAPNRYTEFLSRMTDDSALIKNLSDYVHASGISDLGSPALLASILTSDTYKYDELLVPPAAGVTPAQRTGLLNQRHARFGGTLRNSALGALATNDEDTLFINYNMEELKAIVAANPTDPRNAAYAEILSRQNEEFDNFFPRDKYPDGVVDPGVRQMLTQMKFLRYKGGSDKNLNAIKHNLNNLIGADGAGAIIECSSAYGNAINGAYGRRTMPAAAGDTALIAQNKILEVMCKKNGMNKRETDAVLNRTTKYDTKGMVGIGNIAGLGLRNFMTAAGTSFLISAASTVNPMLGAAIGVGFAAHSIVKMGVGEFNAAKERLTHGSVQPSNIDVWKNVLKSGGIKRMVTQGVFTAAAFLLPAVPGIGPFLRANPLVMPVAFAAKSGFGEFNRSRDKGLTMGQAIGSGIAAGAGGFLGGLVGRAAGYSFSDGYAQADVKDGEGLRGIARGSLSGLKNLGGDIAKVPGHVAAGVAGVGVGAAVAGGEDSASEVTEPGSGVKTATQARVEDARLQQARDATQTGGRIDANNDGYDDRYESWANENSNKLTMFKGGHYVDKATGAVVNPHDMDVQPGSFRWVGNGTQQHLGDLNAQQEAALRGDLAQARQDLNALQQRYNTLESSRFNQNSLQMPWHNPQLNSLSGPAPVSSWDPFGLNSQPQVTGDPLGLNQSPFGYKLPLFPETTQDAGTVGGRVDVNPQNGIDDAQEWALNGDPKTMFAKGYYADGTGNPVNPHLMSVKPGTFHWVSTEQSQGTAAAATGGGRVESAARPPETMTPDGPSQLPRGWAAKNFGLPFVGIMPIPENGY